MPNRGFSAYTPFFSPAFPETRYTSVLSSFDRLNSVTSAMVRATVLVRSRTYRSEPVVFAGGGVALPLPVVFAGAAFGSPLSASDNTPFR